MNNIFLNTAPIKIINIMVNLHNYCSDDIDINMKSYILYIVYSSHI